MPDPSRFCNDEKWRWDKSERIYRHESGSSSARKPAAVAQAEGERAKLLAALNRWNEQLRSGEATNSRAQVAEIIAPFLALPHLVREGTNWSDVRGALLSLQDYAENGVARATARHGIDFGRDNQGGGDCLFLAVAGGHARLARVLRAAAVRHLQLVLRDNPADKEMQRLMRGPNGEDMARPGVWAEINHCAVLAVMLERPIYVWHTENGGRTIMCADATGRCAYAFHPQETAYPGRDRRGAMPAPANTIHLVHVQDSFARGLHFVGATLHGRETTDPRSIATQLAEWHKTYLTM